MSNPFLARRRAKAGDTGMRFMVNTGHVEN